MVINLFFFKIVPPFFKYYFSIPKDHIIYQRKLYIVACCKIILGKNLPFAFFQISLSITKPKENRLPAVPISNLLEKITVPRIVGYKENQLPLVLISNLLGRPTSKENRLPTIAISNLLSQKLSSWTIFVA